MKAANVLYDNIKQISYGGLTLPAMHIAFINHITELHILNFILSAIEYYLLL